MLIFNGTIDTDLLDGTANADSLSGLAGNDTIFGREANDVLNGDEGNDLLSGNQGEDTANGGEGDDEIRGGQENDLLFGDAGNDTINGDRGNDTAFGGDGEDLLFGDIGSEANYTGNGSDILYGGLGNDILFGLGGNDWLFGGDRDDLLCANKGDDTVFGDDGNDVIRGGQDKDLLFGGAGNDLIFGDLGADTATGGEGNDIFVIGRRFDVPGFRTTGGLTTTDADWIADFTQGQDLIELIGGLTFEDLNTFNGNGAYTGNAIIQDKLTGEYLVILQGIDANKINGKDFIPPGNTPPSAGTLQFSAANFSVNEDGTPVAAVTITRTNGSSGAIGVQVILQGGTAVGGSSPLAAPKDYDNNLIAVNWTDGDTSPKTVIVPLFDDTENEGNETVNLNLDFPTGGAKIGAQNTAVLTIVDNDAQPIPTPIPTPTPTPILIPISPQIPTPGTLSFTSANYSENEGDSGISNQVVATIQRTGGSDGTVTVQVQLDEGSTATPNDFTNNLPIAVTFNSGENTKTVQLPIIGDTIVEGNDTINLKLVNPTGGANLGTQRTTTYTIVNDDISIEPEIEVLDGEVNITDGKGAVDFGSTTVNQDITKTFTVKNIGTADLNLNSIALPNGFSLASGFGSSTLAAREQTTFSIKLNASAIGKPSGTIYFGNNDTDENPFDFEIGGKITAVPTPEIEVLEGENNIADGTTTAIDLGKTNVGTPVTKTFTVKNIGSATLNLLERNSPNGFSWIGTLPSNIAPGGSATFEVQLNATNAGNFNSTLQFTNNDSDESPFDFPIAGTVLDIPATVSITAADADAAETDVNIGSFRITRTGNTTNTLTVNLEIDASSTVTSNAGSVFPIDYNFSISGGGSIAGTGATRTLIIPAGESFVDVTVTPLNDEHAEADETLKLNLAAGSYIIDGSNNSATVTIAANDTVVINTNDSASDYTLREGSLRQAMLNAIATPGSDTITFSGAGTSGTINLTAALPEISGANANNTTINGPGAIALTVRRNTGGNYRIFTVGNGVNANFSNLTIANGLTNLGAGIFNDNGTVTVTNSILSGNISQDLGGGIFNQNGTVIVTDSILSANMAQVAGSGILNNGSGTAIFTNSTISIDNTANFFGGGLSNFGATSTVSLTNSTIKGNPTKNGIIGINNLNGGRVDITNSTISGFSSYQGSGIQNANGGTVNITNSTISGNRSDSYGGGIANLQGIVNVKNSIIAGNNAPNSPDFGGILTSQGYNIIGNTSGTNITGTTTGNILNLAANLGPLQNNGGSRETIALLADSPAINGGDPNFTTPPNTDQRGTGYNRVNGGRIDIGAFESNFTPEIVVRNNSTEIAETTESIDFGSTSLGNSITQAFTINNTGNGVLTLSNLVLPAAFELLGTFPATVAAGSSATFNVRFNANSIGDVIGDLMFNNNDANENPFVVAIAGRVT